LNRGGKFSTKMGKNEITSSLGLEVQPFSNEKNRKGTAVLDEQGEGKNEEKESIQHSS
jgi:hypothetical protein